MRQVARDVDERPAARHQRPERRLRADSPFRLSNDFKIRQALNFGQGRHCTLRQSESNIDQMRFALQWQGQDGIATRHARGNVTASLTTHQLSSVLAMAMRQSRCSAAHVNTGRQRCRASAMASFLAGSGVSETRPCCQEGQRSGSIAASQIMLLVVGCLRCLCSAFLSPMVTVHMSPNLHREAITRRHMQR